MQGFTVLGSFRLLGFRGKGEEHGVLASRASSSMSSGSRTTGRRRAAAVEAYAAGLGRRT